MWDFHSLTSILQSVSAPVRGLLPGDLMPAQVSFALRDTLPAILFLARAWRDDGGGLWHISFRDSRLCINGVQVNAVGSFYTE